MLLAKSLYIVDRVFYENSSVDLKDLTFLCSKSEAKSAILLFDR